MGSSIENSTAYFSGIGRILVEIVESLAEFYHNCGGCIRKHNVKLSLVGNAAFKMYFS